MRNDKSRTLEERHHMVAMGHDEGTTDEREIWEVTDVNEEDLEMTEGEGFTVDHVVQLLELVGWDKVNDKEKVKELS
jgi:hypothetical protein